MKHVCIRTSARFDSEWYVTSENQLDKDGDIGHGTFFDDNDQAQKHCARMRERWPNEKFEVFALVSR